MQIIITYLHHSFVTRSSYVSFFQVFYSSNQLFCRSDVKKFVIWLWVKHRSTWLSNYNNDYILCFYSLKIKMAPYMERRVKTSRSVLVFLMCAHNIKSIGHTSRDRCRPYIIARAVTSTWAEYIIFCFSYCVRLAHIQYLRHWADDALQIFMNGDLIDFFSVKKHIWTNKDVLYYRCPFQKSFFSPWLFVYCCENSMTKPRVHQTLNRIQLNNLLIKHFLKNIIRDPTTTYA